jgi:hypothetical protein
MPLLLRKTGDPVWVPTPKRQVEDGLAICLVEGKIWSTTGLPPEDTVSMRPADVVAVLPT